MASGTDPVECLLHAMRDALAPLESGLMHAAKGFETHLSSSRSEGKNVEFRSRFDGSVVKMVRDSVIDVVVVVPEGKNKMPIKPFGTLFPNLCAGNGDRDGSRKIDFWRQGDGEEESKGSCPNCFQFSPSLSALLNNLVQAIPSPFKSIRKCFSNASNGEDKPVLSPRKPSKKIASFDRPKKSDSVDGEIMPLEFIVCCALENLVHNIRILEKGFNQGGSRSCDEPSSYTSLEPPKFDHLKIIKSLIIGRKAHFDGFLVNMKFARVGGAHANLIGTDSPVNEESENPSPASDKEEPESTSSQKIATGLLNIPLSNVEKLKSTLSTVLLTELVEFIPQLGRSAAEHPDKRKLFSVQDFFRYAEAEGRRFFEELDRDGDGQVNLEDLEVAMRKRKLPRRYAKDFLRKTRSNLFSKSIGWKQFLTLMEQKEPTILRAYTTLCLSKSGTLQKNQILTSLRSAGLPASEDNAFAMMRYLNANSDESISYSHFRNFMLLLPSERLEEDPRSIWFEPATVVAVPPPVEISAGNVLKSALAGGLACALSTSMLYHIDTMKTRVQASTLSFPELISKLPQIGIRGLYRGSIPAILGQFSSHGLRTGIFEASKLVLVNVAPDLPEIQVQSLASFCSTTLGTAIRIPCEVLKQRLQAGLFDNAGEAIIGTLQQDGLKGFFRGTGATLCREVPFYVAGMCLYAEAKKGVQSLLNRDLEPWEIIAVGALSGGFAAVITTPFDVMKTRMMTAPQGLPVSMQMVAFSILRKEGPLGLFKGAVPRFFWIAPLGAMNFAGYELAKKAMDKTEDIPG